MVPCHRRPSVRTRFDQVCPTNAWVRRFVVDAGPVQRASCVHDEQNRGPPVTVMTVFPVLPNVSSANPVSGPGRRGGDHRWVNRHGVRTTPVGIRNSCRGQRSFGYLDDVPDIDGLLWGLERLTFPQAPGKPAQDELACLRRPKLAGANVHGSWASRGNWAGGGRLSRLDSRASGGTGSARLAHNRGGKLAVGHVRSWSTSIQYRGSLPCGDRWGWRLRLRANRGRGCPWPDRIGVAAR